MSSQDQDQILNTLHGVILGMRSTTETDQMLQRMTVAATNLTNSEAGSILQFDPSANCLRFVAAPWFHQKPLKQVSIPIEGSMAGWAFSTRETLIVQNVETDQRHFRAVDLATKFKTSSLLASPLIFQGKAIGVLEVINKSDNAHYTEVDVTILELIAGYISIALYQMDPEDRVDKTLTELTELNQLKKNIIAITSHELRTPLGLILGHATFLREMIDEEFREPIDVIVSNAVRLKEIVEDLTDVDNYESGLARLRLQSISTSSLLQEILSPFQDMASNKNITLQIEILNDCVVEVDKNKIIIALGNLLQNALTFTDSGGEVHIKVESIQGNAQITVQDTGIGIPAKDLPKVFDRFYQIESHLTRRHGGMGLGLSVAKSMIEMHGGRIWAESDEGQGSSFIISLPLLDVQGNESREVPFS
jgi:signal transduction histidine kinase